jgi:hypothetical protein
VAAERPDRAPPAKAAGKRPGPARRDGEGRLAWRLRWWGWWLARRPGSPFELLAEFRHPVVRAELRRTRAGRLRVTAVCVGLPLLVFLLVFAARTGGLLMSSLGGALQVPVALLVCFWPLVMYLGAALAAAGAVSQEIDQDTALQLVLTPVPARPLAAAKVLPRALPYMWGIVAALPAYAAAGSSPVLLLKGIFPSPLAVWPLRTVAVLGAAGNAWRLGSTPAGCLLIAPLMCLFDLAAVWTAAQWGAILAIRGRGLLRVAAGLVGNLFLTTAAVGLCALAGFIAGALPASCAVEFSSATHGELGFTIAAAVGILVGASVFTMLYWRTVLRRAGEEVLTAFQAFDRLANPEFSPGLPRWAQPPAHKPSGSGRV